MELAKAYRYCPRCGHKVSQEGEFLLVCTHCKFRNYLSPSPCNAAIIENDQQEVLLVRRANEPHKDEWDLPGGFIMPEEDFVSSLKREIKEELCCEIIVGKIVGVYTTNYTYQDIIVPTISICAVCQITSDSIKPMDDVSEYKFFLRSSVMEQKIAFPSVRQALRDYFSE